MRSSARLWPLAAVVVAATSSARAQEDPNADLVFAKTVAEQSPAGSDVPFEVTVTNQGPDPAVNVVLTDRLPAATTFVSAIQNSGPTFSCTTPAIGDGGTVTCDLATLDAGASASFTFVLHIDPGTPAGEFITNVGTAASSTFDPNDENSSGSATTQVPPPPIADMTVTKRGPTHASPPTDAIYTIELTNNGPGGATNVTLTDSLPALMPLLSISQDSGPAVVCTSEAGGAIVCVAPTFPAGGTTVLTVTGHISADTPDESIFQNFVSVTSDYDTNSENDDATWLLCVQADYCMAGCSGPTPVVCTASQCEDPGTCDSATGACLPSTPKANGTPCDDGSACTLTDACQSGVCTGGDVVTCAVADQCEEQGTCDTVTGACAPNLPKVDGAVCDDGNACTRADLCVSGVCNGTDPVVCVIASQCRTQGQCNIATGVCGPNPPKVDGTGCDDGSACTGPDLCQSGRCTGTNPVVCVPAAVCEEQGTCDGSTGVCAPNLPKDEGAACDDGDGCTEGEICQSGVCTAGAPVVCPPAGPCEEQGTCDEGIGACAPNPPKDDGTACNDGSVCTEADSCHSGVCQGAVAVDCDDGVLCTSDSCDAVLGCVHVASCDDAGVLIPPPDAAVADARPVDAAFAVDAAAAADARQGGGFVDARPAPDAARSPDAAGPDADSGGGCACRAAGGPGTLPLSVWLVFVGLFAVRRRSGRRSKAPRHLLSSWRGCSKGAAHPGLQPHPRLPS